MFELEQARVFRRSWLPLCHLSQIAGRDTFLTREVFGESVVATRDQEGEIRVLSNVCRHRNALVAKGSSQCRHKHLICPYHGWTYGLDGKLLAAPQMDQSKDFVRADYPLPVMRHEIWQEFVFVNFDPHAPSLAPQLADLTPLAEPYHFERMKAVPVRRAAVPWNWKVSLERTISQ
jgi:phenylpropionate dioxygenase-like ring-hydroxylating dioxygenase large terminal subunit